MKSDLEIATQVKRDRQKSQRELSAQYEAFRKARSFYAGDYMEYVDKVQFATTSGQKKRVVVQINKVKPYVNALKGFFAQNRRKPNYVAVMPDNPMQVFYSKYANALSEYLRANCAADQVETQQDGDMLVCGIGAVETALTFGEGYASRSANGEVEMRCLDIESFWWDGSARETGLVDSRYMGVTKQYDLDEALVLFSGSEEDDFERGNIKDDSRYSFQDDLGSYDRIKYDWYDKKENVVNVHFYQWYDIIKYFRADNPVRALTTPEAQQAAAIEMQLIASEVDDDDFDPSDDIISFNAETKARLDEAFGEFLETEEFRRKCFYSAIVSGDKVFQHEKSQHQDGFTIKVKTGDYDAKNKIWTGIVHSMMEPQKYYNKALTELMFIISANSKGGVIVESDAVEDISEFEDQYARTDAVCVVEPGAISNNKIRDKKSPFQPTGYEQIVTLSDAAISDVIGVDKTFLGSSENKLETAMLQRQRIRQIVSTMACYVDSIVAYTREEARLMLDLMRIWAKNNRGALFRMLGERGASEFIAVSDDKLAAEFEIVIEEALITPEEKAELSMRLTGIGDKLSMAGDLESGKKLYALALKYEPMDQDDVQAAQEILAPQQHAIDPAYVQQLEMTVQQLQNVMTQAQLEKVMSEVVLNKAKVEQTKADVQVKAANVTKTLEEAEQTSLENRLVEQAKTANVNI